MELILSAISAGGLVGASNQYACLLIVAFAAKLKMISLTPQLDFMMSYWFIAILAFFWLLTTAPAYASLLSPGVMNAIHTITNLLSSFLVPLSSALLSLASIGIIVGLKPELRHFIESFKLFTAEGNLGTTSIFVAAAGGLSGAALNALRGVSKPAISASTGTTGTVSAPIFATLENLASILFMALAYVLSKVNPWLLVILFGIIILSILVMVVFAVRQLWRLQKGIGKVLYLAQVEPKAGLAVIAEFFVWGTGWLAWKYWGRGAIMLFILSFWLIIFILVQPLFVGLFAFLPPLLPLAGFVSITFLFVVFILIGLASARSLLKVVEKQVAFKSVSQSAT